MFTDNNKNINIIYTFWSTFGNKINMVYTSPQYQCKM